MITLTAVSDGKPIFLNPSAVAYIQPRTYEDQVGTRVGFANANHFLEVRETLDDVRALISRGLETALNTVVNNLNVPVATDDAAALGFFTDYFVHNYPGPDTVIRDPRWHAPRIFRAVQQAFKMAAAAEKLR